MARGGGGFGKFKIFPKGWEGKRKFLLVGGG